MATNLTSPIFNKAVRRQAVSSFVARQAKDFKKLTKDRMISGPHTGRLVEKKGGRGFSRSHRASRKGQRPSPDTLTLVNAVSDKRTGDTSATVFIAERINPENGEIASNYAERLQNEMSRPIMDERDVFQAKYKMLVQGEKLVGTLI